MQIVGTEQFTPFDVPPVLSRESAQVTKVIPARHRELPLGEGECFSRGDEPVIFFLRGGDGYAVGCCTTGITIANRGL